MSRCAGPVPGRNPLNGFIVRVTRERKDFFTSVTQIYTWLLSSEELLTRPSTCDSISLQNRLLPVLSKLGYFLSTLQSLSFVDASPYKTSVLPLNCQSIFFSAFGDMFHDGNTRVALSQQVTVFFRVLGDMRVFHVVANPF